MKHATLRTASRAACEGPAIAEAAISMYRNEHDLHNEPGGSCALIRLGDRVVVKGDDEEAIVTAVHPDAQIEIEFLHASEGGPRRRRYAAEALEKVPRS